MWIQMFNITSKNTNVKTSLQNDHENDTESSNRNTNGERPEIQHINQSVNQWQVEIDRLCVIGHNHWYTINSYK